MTNKTPDWQDNDKEILSQFPDSPAPELLTLRQEPDWALKAQILSIPTEEQKAQNRYQWTFGGGLLNRLAGAAVLALLVVVLGLWLFSVSTNNPPATTQPEIAAPVSTSRPTALPTATPTRDFSSLSPGNIITATPTETGSCPITPFSQGDPDVEELGLGSYYINENQTIWAYRPRTWYTGGEKVQWVKPAGTKLEISGRLINAENSIPLEVTMACCESDDSQITGLIFLIPGCWELTAVAGEEQIQFITEVKMSEGTAVTGISLLDYHLSSITPTANEPLTITLNWLAGGADAEELAVFFQLIDSNNNIVFQHYETIQPEIWITQKITTTHSMEMINQTGTYSLRLILANNDNFVCIPFYYNDGLTFFGILTLTNSIEVQAE